MRGTNDPLRREHKAPEGGRGGQTPSPGFLSLREAVAEDLKDLGGLDLSPDQIVIASGDDPSPPLRAGFRTSGSRVLALWRGINVFIMIIGLEADIGASPLGSSRRSNGAPIRGVSPQTLKILYISSHQEIFS